MSGGLSVIWQTHRLCISSMQRRGNRGAWLLLLLIMILRRNFALGRNGSFGFTKQCTSPHHPIFPLAP